MISLYLKFKFCIDDSKLNNILKIIWIQYTLNGIKLVVALFVVGGEKLHKSTPRPKSK